MSKSSYHAGDVALIKGRIEFSVNGGAQIVFMTAAAAEQRLQIAASEIVSTEPGPIKPGDSVFVGKGKGLRTGTVIAREAENVWIEWATGDHSVEKVETLSR